MRAFFVSCLVTGCTGAAALEPVADFGANPGNLLMFEHVPDPLPAGPLPLVLALHGCSQDETWAEDVGLVAAADDLGFIVVAAAQRGANNGQGCFNWFEDGDISEGAGEQRSLLSMVESARARHDVDGDRVFVTGLSAGGAMAVVMLATAPSVFAGGASFAGVAYRCGIGVVEAFDCLDGPPARAQNAWRDLVLDEVSSAGPFPPLLVVHGDADSVVADSNADALTLQWTGLFGLGTAPTSTNVASGRTVSVFGDAITVIAIGGMDHGVPVDPPACGSAGAFAPDVDFCGVSAALDFFGLSAAAGEGEGEGEEGEGEGEGEEGEGEGEGEEGEGEGEEGEGEGEGEGDGGADSPGGGCTCAGAATTPLAATLLLALSRRRLRRR